MPKQNICKIPRLGKRQNKTFVKFRGPGNAKTNGGGLSAARETPKQTVADFPQPGKRQNKWRRTFRGPGNAKTNGGAEKRRRFLTIQPHERQFGTAKEDKSAYLAEDGKALE